MHLAVATQREHVVLLPGGTATRALGLVVAVALADTAVLAAGRREAALYKKKKEGREREREEDGQGEVEMGEFSKLYGTEDNMKTCEQQVEW